MAHTHNTIPQDVKDNIVALVKARKENGKHFQYNEISQLTGVTPRQVSDISINAGYRRHRGFTRRPRVEAARSFDPATPAASEMPAAPEVPAAVSDDTVDLIARYQLLRSRVSSTLYEMENIVNELVNKLNSK